MSTPEKERDGQLVVMGTAVPATVAAEIDADAKKEDRTNSAVIRRILTSHYKRRRKAA